MKRNEMIWNI